jgi:cell division protein FtsL
MTKRKGQKDKQHNDQKKRTKGQAKQWPKEKDRRKSNTMTKENDLFLLAMVLLVLLSSFF